MKKVVLIVLAFLNGEPTGKLPEVVYADMATCVADWKAHAIELTPAEGSLQVMCVSEDEVKVLQ